MNLLRKIKSVMRRILNLSFNYFGYEINRRYPDIYLHKYKSYQEYKDIQIFHNKRKINKVWATKNSLNAVIRKIKKELKKNLFGLCHGTRNGFEQNYLASKLSAKIIGTDISNTALNFPRSVVWDFHKDNKAWINKCDFIYTNSLDQSFNPKLALNTWLKQLKVGGLLFVEHSEAHGPQGASEMDPFGVKPNVFPYFIAELFGNKISTEIIHSFMPGEGKSNYPIYIFVIKKLS